MDTHDLRAGLAPIFSRGGLRFHHHKKLTKAAMRPTGTDNEQGSLRFGTPALVQFVVGRRTLQK